MLLLYNIVLRETHMHARTEIARLLRLGSMQKTFLAIFGTE